MLKTYPYQAAFWAKEWQKFFDSRAKALDMAAPVRVYLIPCRAVPARNDTSRAGKRRNKGFFGWISCPAGGKQVENRSAVRAAPAALLTKGAEADEKMKEEF